MAKPIRVLIADDHTIVREGLRTLLDMAPGIECAGEAADGNEAVSKARLLRPDVILMDMVMPNKSGLQAIQEILQEDPRARILVLTSFSDDDMVFPAIKSGALGYLLKDATPASLFAAIRDVWRGEVSLHPTIALKVVRELNTPSKLPPTKHPLTEREVEVLRLVARGLANRDVAAQLSVTEVTVSTHVRNILSKLHLANRTQAALYALREGLAQLE